MAGAMAPDPREKPRAARGGSNQMRRMGRGGRRGADRGRGATAPADHPPPPPRPAPPAIPPPEARPRPPVPLDIIFNGRLVPGGLVHFYSFACRARAGFLAERFADPGRLAPLEEGFWVSFFRGGRLKSTAMSPAQRRSIAPQGVVEREC